MIVFKSPNLKDEFPKLDDRLKAIVLGLSAHLDFNFGKDLILTSIYRDQRSSVHKYWRGVDFRIEPQGQESIYTQDERDSIVQFCNGFSYDPNRPHIKTLKMHDAGSGFHGHLQVSNRTIAIWR